MRLIVLSILLLAILPTTAAQDVITARIKMGTPHTLDPVQLSRFDQPSRDLVENLFIGLTRFNTRSGQVEPMLAESWSVSADGVTWTFNLRDDLQWVQFNGEAIEAIRPIVAGDVVFAIHRACAADRPSPVATSIYIIAGCSIYAEDNSLEPLDPNQVIRATAVDDTTLEIRLLFPASYFLTLTSMPEFRPLPSEFINDSVGNWPRPGVVVTSGPWVVTDWMALQAMRLERNPFWPDAFEGNVEVVDVRFDIPIDGLAPQIEDGTVDFARLEPVILPSFRQTYPDLLSASDGSTLTFLGFAFNNINAEGQLLPSPLDSPAVRRAFALALDRDAIVRGVFADLAEGSDHFTPRSAFASPTSPGATQDIATAQQTLAAAGFPSCAGMRQVTFAISDAPTDLLLAQNLITQWNVNLGCPPETFVLLQTTRRDILDTARNTINVAEETRYDLWLQTWSADYPDAQAWVSDALHCGYGYFRVGRRCDNIDTSMDNAAVTTDARARFSAYTQIEDALFGTNGTFPVIPLALEQTWHVQQPWLSNVASFGSLRFDHWIIERE